MKLQDRLNRARKVEQNQYSEEEGKRLGNLRVGNSGALLADGSIIGQCTRIAHLRSKGVDTGDEKTFSKLIMFDRGFNNEDMIYADLLKTRETGESILREDEIPVVWHTKNGTRVTGRPDMVILVNGKPAWGVEAKSVASVYVTEKILFQSTPKLEHILQTAHYAYCLEVPFKLLYRQYANQAMPEWFSRRLPKPGEPFSEFIEYNDKGAPKHIMPYEVVYDVEVHGSEIRFKPESSTRWQKAAASIDDVVRFFDRAADMATEGLTPRPKTVDIHGKSMSYSMCDYCELKPHCTKFEKQGYDVWFKEIAAKPLKAK